MKSPLLGLLSICALCCATISHASETVVLETSTKPFVLPSGTLPETIFGSVCVTKEADATFAAMLDCEGKDVVKNPRITVSVIEDKCDRTAEQMMEARRNWLNDGTPFFKVVWERKFSPTSVPDGIGYQGFYQKSLGNRYWWETCGQGRLTRVSVIMFGPIDNDALKAEIEQKVFGIIRTTPNASKDTK